MHTDTTHAHLIQRGMKTVFHPPAIAETLVKALRSLTAKPWRIIEIKHDHYARPVILGYGAEYTVKIARTWPETKRAEASIISKIRPHHCSDLPHLPKCTFDPTRAIEAIARDISRKLINKAAAPVEKWKERAAKETKKKLDAEDAMRRVASVLQLKPQNHNRGAIHTSIGPFRLRVDPESGQIQTYMTSYLSEDELIKLVGIFGTEAEPKR